MSKVCDSCFVGGHYLLILKDKKFICIDCNQTIETFRTERYREERLKRCLFPRRKRLKTKDIYSM